MQPEQSAALSASPAMPDYEAFTYGVMSMANPPFTMSKYIKAEDLYKDKAEYYQERCRNAEIALKELLNLAVDELSDPEDCSQVHLANFHLNEYTIELKLAT